MPASAKIRPRRAGGPGSARGVSCAGSSAPAAGPSCPATRCAAASLPPSPA